MKKKTKRSIIQEIEKIYSFKKIVIIFFVEVIFFQILAWFTAGNLYWIIGDYLWYSFIFLGLIEAINIAKRNAKLSWERTYLQRVELSKHNLLNGIALDLKTFDVEIKDYFEIKNRKIKSNEVKSRLEKMQNHFDTSVLSIKKIIDSLDDDIEKLWNQEVYENLINLNSIVENDISIIVQSKKSLSHRIDNFNGNIIEYRDIISSKEKTRFEDFKMRLLPFLMSLIVAIQLGNITNRLLLSLAI